MSRTRPVKVTSAPISVRPSVSALNSAPMSKSSVWTRIMGSAACHRWEEGDLARARNRRVEIAMLLIDCAADNGEISESMCIAFPACFQPVYHACNIRDAVRKHDVLFGDAGAFFHTGEVEQFHLWPSCSATALAGVAGGLAGLSSRRCSMPARK